METDIRYYRRRASEEMIAATRAVTSAARARRLYLVGLYLERLKALNAPSPFDERQLADIMSSIGNPAAARPAFAWTGSEALAEPA